VYYASGRTRLYRNIGITFMVLGLPVTYFLLAPGAMRGLSAGAAGLAAKMVGLQIVWVNVQLYFNCRMLGLKMTTFVLHQVSSIAVLLALAAASVWLVDQGLGKHHHDIAAIMLSGILYTAAVAGMIAAVPWIAGLNRHDIDMIRTTVAASLRR